MKKIYIILSTAILAMACNGGSKTFSSPDGATNAYIDNNGHWQITDANGRSIVSSYDSLSVLEVDSTGSPLTICYHISDSQQWVQYYPDLSIRSRGTSVNGKRHGHWTFYFPNGNKQAEATYVNGLEDGLYTVYRENGIPYYRGHYASGRQVGIWEFYDPDGNLYETKQMD